MVFGINEALVNRKVESALGKHATKYAQVEAAIEPSDKVLKELASREKSAKQAIAEMTAYKGGFGDNVKSMISRFGDVFKKSGKVSAEELAEKAAKIVEKPRAGFFQRLAAKPFGWAAKNPKTAMVVGGLAAVAGIGSVVKKRAERRTEAEAQAAMMEAQMQQQPLAQANTYQISPEEYAAMQARMKGGAGVPQTGHADSVMAARESGSQVMAPSV